MRRPDDDVDLHKESWIEMHSVFCEIATRYWSFQYIPLASCNLTIRKKLAAALPGPSEPVHVKVATGAGFRPQLEEPRSFCNAFVKTS
jgi:hypothetical protein